MEDTCYKYVSDETWHYIGTGFFQFGSAAYCAREADQALEAIARVKLRREYRDL